MTTDVAPPPAAAPSPQPSSYPIGLQVIRPEASSRLLNFPLSIGMLIRYVVVIPHLVALFFIGAVGLVLYLIATVAILFTGKYPRGLYSFVEGTQRWSTNVNVYVLGLVDRYPPFSMDSQEGFPVAYTAEYPEKSNRLLNFPIFGLYIKYFLSIPNVLVLGLLSIVAFVILVIAPFAVLFTGRYPEGMHRFMVGVQRWSARVGAYFLGLTDRYPPFSMS